MRATFVIALVLSASVLSAEAARTRIAAKKTSESDGVTDEVEAPLNNTEMIRVRVKEVDWSEKDAWIVFESDGIGVKEYANTLDHSNPVTLPAFLDTLQGCGPRGVACFGIFKFNPLKRGSTTPTPKSLLLMANDATSIKKKLGIIKGLKVVVGTSSTVWGKFQKAIVVKLPNAETDSPGKLTAEDIWSKFTDTNDENKKMFLKHCENMRDDGSHVGPGHHDEDEGTPIPGDSTPTPEPGNEAGHGGDSSGGGGGTMDARQTERLIQSAVKQAKAEMKQEIEEISTKISRSEVGQALRKLGGDVGDKITDVGKIWITKGGR